MAHTFSPGGGLAWKAELAAVGAALAARAAPPALADLDAAASLLVVPGDAVPGLVKGGGLGVPWALAAATAARRVDWGGGGAAALEREVGGGR